MALGLPPSPMMDRHGDGISSSQLGFFVIVALPLFSSLVGILPRCQPLLTALQRNKACWQHIAAVNKQAAAAGRSKLVDEVGMRNPCSTCRTEARLSCLQQQQHQRQQQQQQLRQAG